MPKLVEQFAVQLICQEQFHRMPWKNGKGETLELLCQQDEQGIRWRISQAAVVEDGVFSDFTGMQRILVLLSGQGMQLTHQFTESHNLTQPLDMARFAGFEHTVASLTQGPIEDLNIMVRQTDTQAQVTALVANANQSLTRQTDSYFYANEVTEIQLTSLLAAPTLEAPKQSIKMPKDSLLILAREALTPLPETLSVETTEETKVEARPVHSLSVLTGSGVFIEISTTAQ